MNDRCNRTNVQYSSENRNETACRKIVNIAGHVPLTSSGTVRIASNARLEVNHGAVYADGLHSSSVVNALYRFIRVLRASLTLPLELALVPPRLHSFFMRVGVSFGGVAFVGIPRLSCPIELCARPDLRLLLDWSLQLQGL